MLPNYNYDDNIVQRICSLWEKWRGYQEQPIYKDIDKITEQSRDYQEIAREIYCTMEVYSPLVLAVFFQDQINYCIRVNLIVDRFLQASNARTLNTSTCDMFSRHSAELKHQKETYYKAINAIYIQSGFHIGQKQIEEFNKFVSFAEQLLIQTFLPKETCTNNEKHRASEDFLRTFQCWLKGIIDGYRALYIYLKEKEDLLSQQNASLAINDSFRCTTIVEHNRDILINLYLQMYNEI